MQHRSALEIRSTGLFPSKYCSGLGMRIMHALPQVGGPPKIHLHSDFCTFSIFKSTEGGCNIRATSRARADTLFIHGCLSQEALESYIRFKLSFLML